MIGRPAIRRFASQLRSEHARDAAWALADHGSALLASTFSFLLFGRTLGAAGYGAYVGLYGLIGPFVALGQAGVYLAAMEHVARAGETPAEVGRSCMSITTVNALVWVPLLCVASPSWIKGLPPLAAVLLIGTECFLSAIFTQSVGIVQALTGFPAAARLRVTNSLLRIIPLATLAAMGSLTLTSLAIAQAFTIGSMMVYAVSRTSRLAGLVMRPGRIRMQHVRSVLLYALQVGATSVQNDSDKFILNAAHHQADAGRYGAASRIMWFSVVPILALVNATHLSFLRTGADATTQLRRAIRLSVVSTMYALPAAIGLFLAAPLAPLLFSRDFSETTRMLQWLAPLVILRGQSSFPTNGLMGLGRNGLRTKLIVAHGVLSVLLYVALIPTYSWRGAFAAALFTELSLAITSWSALIWCERAARVRTSGPALAGVEGA